MIVSKSYESKYKLYLVPTPIGNISDMTKRSIDILKSVNRIYCEDTRTSIMLLKYYNINTPLFSYHLFNEKEESEKIIEYIKNGNDVALISDAGLPIIQDPGKILVNLCYQNDISVITLPGASAFVTAFCSSGFDAPFLFYGFLKSKQTERLNELESLKNKYYTIIFYESPNRIKDLINDLYNVYGNKKIFIAREISKKHEEYIKGDLIDLINYDIILKGEFVVILENKEQNNAIDIENRFILVDNLVKTGVKLTEAIKEIAKSYNLNRQEFYKEYLEYKK